MAIYLNKEEEKALGKIICAYKDGEATKEEALEAHKKLFDNNVNNARKQVHTFFAKFRYQIPHYDIEDAMQDAMLELARGIWDYDPVKFDTKCYTNIWYRVCKTLDEKMDYSRSFPLKVGASRKARRIFKEIEKLHTQSINEPDIDIIDFLDKSLKDLKRSDIVSLLSAHGLLLSIEPTFVESEQGKRVMVFSDDYSNFTDKPFHFVYELMKKLNDKERSLISYEFGLNNSNDLSIEEVLEHYNLTMSEYDFTIKQIIKKLKKISKRTVRWW